MREHGVDYLRTIKDPEYPMNLEQLNVIQVSFWVGCQRSSRTSRWTMS